MVYTVLWYVHVKIFMDCSKITYTHRVALPPPACEVLSQIHSETTDIPHQIVTPPEATQDPDANKLTLPSTSEERAETANEERATSTSTVKETESVSISISNPNTNYVTFSKYT